MIFSDLKMSVIPRYQGRLGHRDRFRFKQVGHGQREDLAPERVGTLSEPCEIRADGKLS